MQQSTKPQLTLINFGPRECGKSTLALAISAVQQAKGLAKSISMDEYIGDYTSLFFQVDFETSSRRYRLLEYDIAQARLIKHCVTDMTFHGGIFVVDATEMSMMTSNEYPAWLGATKQAGIPAVVAYINKTDAARFVLDLDRDLRGPSEDALAAAGYHWRANPSVYGSALQALQGQRSPLADQSITRLLDFCDRFVPLPAKV